MKPITSTLKRRYRDLLRRSFDARTGPSPATTQRLGQQIANSDLSVVDLAQLHERVLSKHLQPVTSKNQRTTITRNAGAVFGAVVTAADSGDGYGATAQLPALLSSLSQRSHELADSNASLIKEIEQRKAAETALAASEAEGREMLRESERLQGQLRSLSRQLLAAQEDERCKISRELHDVIGQTLTGITIQLTALKQESQLNTASLNRGISQTQRLVNKSVSIVHRFARELRPAVLDDLGLRPALKAHLKSAARRSSTRITLSICAEADQLEIDFRTVLYRVGQEALTNVIRHARARTASLAITRTKTGLRMVVQDDGKGFSVARTFNARNNTRLGLLGMRERVEMIGGRFAIVSKARQGTAITVDIPFKSAPSPSSRTPGKSDQGKSNQNKES